MSARRVAITGLGVICALGRNTAEIDDAIRAGRSAIAAIHSVDVAQLRFKNGAQVAGYDCGEYFEPSLADLLDPFAQFAMIAAREAVRGSGLAFTPEVCEKTAV